MTKLLEQAFGAMQHLPSETQDALARWMLNLAAGEETIEAIEATHRPAVLEGLAQAQARTFATDVDVDAVFRRFGP